MTVNQLINSQFTPTILSIFPRDKMALSQLFEFRRACRVTTSNFDVMHQNTFVTYSASVNSFRFFLHTSGKSRTMSVTARTILSEQGMNDSNWKYLKI